MRVLVTGGSGFLGGHLVRRLVARGDEVRIVDLLPYPPGDVDCVVGDLRERAVVERALEPGFDAVVHLAALTSVLQSVRDPEAIFNTNVLATHYLLERARAIGCRRFVLASSSAVIGDVGRETIREDLPMHPLTPYGATKAAGEMLLSAYGASYGFMAVALRFTNLYGTRMQLKDSVIARLMKAAVAKTGIQIYGDGEQMRDYLYISDACAAIELALGLEAPTTLAIGSQESISMNDLFALVCEVTGVELHSEHIAPKPGEMPAVFVDTKKARAAGWQPRYSLRQGLEETWADFEKTAG